MTEKARQGKYRFKLIVMILSKKFLSQKEGKASCRHAEAEAIILFLNVSIVNEAGTLILLKKG